MIRKSALYVAIQALWLLVLIPAVGLTLEWPIAGHVAVAMSTITQFLLVARVWDGQWIWQQQFVWQ